MIPPDMTSHKVRDGSLGRGYSPGNPASQRHSSIDTRKDIQQERGTVSTANNRHTGPEENQAASARVTASTPRANSIHHIENSYTDEAPSETNSAPEHGYEKHDSRKKRRGKYTRGANQPPMTIWLQTLQNNAHPYMASKEYAHLPRFSKGNLKTPNFGQGVIAGVNNDIVDHDAQHRRDSTEEQEQDMDQTIVADTGTTGAMNHQPHTQTNATIKTPTLELTVVSQPNTGNNNGGDHDHPAATSKNAVIPPTQDATPQTQDVSNSAIKEPQVITQEDSDSAVIKS
jgi:hypothetical protein